jgi:CBS domain-containing protein
MILVRDRMTTPVVTVSINATLDDVLALFDQESISAVPVTSDGRLVGVVSTTDVLRSLSRVEARRITAESLITGPALVARPDEPIDEAARRLVASRVHRLVVADGERPVGILSTRDLYEEILTRRPTQPIRGIMTAPVETVDIGDSIDVATRLLTLRNVRGLVALDMATPVGVYTHREAIAARLLPRELRERPIEEVMSYETICLNVDTPIFRAAAYGSAMNVRRFLIVEHRQLVGIVSSLDLAGTVGFGSSD